MTPPSNHRHDESIEDAPSPGSPAPAERTPAGTDPANERTDEWQGVGRWAEASSSLATSSPPEGLQEDAASAGVTKESDHSQSLRSKLVLALAIMLGVVVSIDEIVRQKVIAPEFANLERVAALKDTNRVLSAINTEIEFLAETASLDASRLGAQLLGTTERPTTASQSVTTPPTIRGLGNRVEWAAVVDPRGTWTWLADRQPESNENDPTTPSDLLPQQFPGVADLIAKSRSGKINDVRGMTRSKQGQLHLFAAIPIDAHGGSGAGRPTTGVAGKANRADKRVDRQRRTAQAYFVVGRRFGAAVVSDLQQRTSVLFSFELTEGNTQPRKTIEIAATDKSTLCVLWPLLSPSGIPLAELKVQLPREVTNRSSRTTAFARYLSLCGACVSLLLLLLLLQRIVIGRIETIREHTERIAQAGIISEESTAPVLHVAGHDEIGQLAKSFDRMRTRLGDAQRRLSDTSHAAGMSLVADTVIHNVGNVLTNVNSLIETATRRVEGLRIEPLEKLADRLRNNNSDEALQKATPDYLQRLSQTLEDDKDDLACLLQTLNDNVQHIHQVIRDQRRHAHQPVKWEQLELRSVVSEAVKCSQARLNQDNVQVDFHCDLGMRIWTDRSLLLQILINIVSNAGNATRDISNRKATLAIDTIRTTSTAHIRFRDNGCGMDAETLERVFDAHFTTRPSGSGLGLHFCAIAMKRIGGRIRAESDGPNRGATFVIEVPIHKPTTSKRAGRAVEVETQQDTEGLLLQAEFSGGSGEIDERL